MTAHTMALDPVPGFDPRQFRAALGQFATGVTVVTATDMTGGYVGVTASSFNSVSVDPPLILWSIDNGSRSRPVFEQAEYFAVNVLAADQVSVSNHFARQQDDKFSSVDFELDHNGVPVLQGCSACFHCKTRYLYEGGDHTIIVGEVVQFDSSGRDGLLFHQGRYSVSEVHPVASINATPAENADDEQGFAADYLHYLVGRCFTQLIGKLEKVLLAEGLSQYEYRALSSFGGLTRPDLDTLCHYSILSSDELKPVLESLVNRGLVAPVAGETRWALTDEGRDRLMQLLTRAKSDEADMLGGFNDSQAQQFKAMLKAAIDWTK